MSEQQRGLGEAVKAEAGESSGERAEFRVRHVGLGGCRDTFDTFR